MTRSFSLLLLPCAVAFAGCALQPGEPFATIRPTLTVAVVIPEDRARPGGFARLASDYELQLTEAVVGVEELSLVEQRSSGGGAPAGGGGTFDPANPPPGYSNCHGGHCHRDDGALIPYEEIQAELSGGGGGVVQATLITLPVGEDFSALERTERDLSCDPDCGLDMVTVDSLRAQLTRVVFRGTVRDSRAMPRLAPTAFVLDVPLEADAQTPGGVLTLPLDLVADREHFPNVALNAAIEPQPRIFDAVDWAQLTTGAAGIDLGAPENEPARLAILDAFAQTALAAEVVRSP